jgi:hypothetical protein
MSKEQQYTLLNGGRVKMAGGSVDTYYECAEPTITQGINEADKTARAFKELRDKPSLPLLLSFFPDEPKNIKQRLRGAGLYRHLRMDQGPGGNFTAFELSKNNNGLNYALTNEHGFALLEYPVQEQINTGQFGAIIPLISDIQAAFQQNNYRKTAQLVEQFQLLSAQAGLALPSGEQVGSKTGFFFIRPVETNRPVTFPVKHIDTVKAEVTKALIKPKSLAEYARSYLLQGHSYQASITLAEQDYDKRGPTSYSGNDLLYFQPDCFVSNDGQVEVEKVNMPDVGLFLTQIETQGNQPLERVVAVNKRLRNQVEAILESELPGDYITLVTRDEVLAHRSDSLELLEIQALQDSLEKSGKKVSVVPLSAARHLDKKTQVILLNIQTNHPTYEQLVQTVVQKDITCFPDPLLKAFEDQATTLRKIELSGKRLEKFLDLIKPKDINSSNAAHLQAEIFKYLAIADIAEDIIYVSFDGLNTPIPVFKYSLHSFFQIYNALEKEYTRGNKPDKICFSPIPFTRETAPFIGQDGPRLSAFRFMFTK